MAKFNIGDTVTHSRFGAGTITRLGVRTVTPPPVDKVRLDGERWRLKARLAEIEALLAADPSPYEEDFYQMSFTDAQGRPRTIDGNDATVERLAARAAVTD